MCHHMMMISASVLAHQQWNSEFSWHGGTVRLQLVPAEGQKFYLLNQFLGA